MSGRIRPQDLQRVLDAGKSDTDAGRRISGAIALVEQVLDDLGEEAIAISFNGGKDCTVLLHLYAAVLYARHGRLVNGSLSADTTQADRPSSSGTGGHSADGGDTQHETNRPPSGPSSSSDSRAPELFSNPAGGSAESSHSSPSSSSRQVSSVVHIAPPSSMTYPPIKAIYITAPNPFPALDDFVHSSAGLYGMDLYRFGGGMKAALAEYLGCTSGQGVKGMLMGTRKGDPNGGEPHTLGTDSRKPHRYPRSGKSRAKVKDVQPLAPTDPSWPRILRIHPILDWTYTQVWDFLRDMDVPYCSLYDEGYTSLGSTTNTVPNPLLRVAEPPGGWEPAWKLQDGSKERCGRLDSSS